jgi:putative membrane protein
LRVGVGGRALAMAALMVVWDVSLDPAMVKNQFWLWSVPDLSGEPLWQRVIGTPFFYGMPLTNWLGWLLTGIVVARVMLVVVPPSAWARHVSPSRFPLVLYAVNGVLPIAICFGQDMLWGGVFGTLAMAWPLWAAWRREPAVRAAASPARAPLGGAPVPPVALAGD